MIHGDTITIPANKKFTFVVGGATTAGADSTGMFINRVSVGGEYGGGPPFNDLGIGIVGIRGPSSSASGPHIEAIVSTDDHPVWQLRNWAHDNWSMGIDSYRNNASTSWLSSFAGGNFMFQKLGGTFYMRHATGVAPGEAITWTTSIFINMTTNRVGFGTITPVKAYHFYVSGGTPPAAYGDGVLIQNNGTTTDQARLVLISGNESINSSVDFGDTDNSVTGQVAYNHLTDSLYLRTAGISNRILLDANGNVGIGGLSTLPHGSRGGGRLHLHGTVSNQLTGPHVQITSTNDVYPIFQMLNWSHDNINLSFDSYYDGGWKSGDAGSNVQIRKSSDVLSIYYDNGIAPGGSITWNNLITMNLLNGNIGVGGAPGSEKMSVYGGNFNSASGSGYGYAFRGRTDQGIFDETFSLSMMAPNHLIFHLDSNNNNADNTYMAIVKNQATPGSITNELFRFTESGRLGIGTASPGYPLDVAGSAHATSFPTSSDVRLKSNIRQMESALEKVNNMRGVHFNWNMIAHSLGRVGENFEQTGVIAQELFEVAPELVTMWEAYEGDEEQYMAVDYSRLTAYLIEAVKELTARLKLLEEKVWQ